MSEIELTGKMQMLPGAPAYMQPQIHFFVPGKPRCSVEGCDDLYSCRGYCNRHYLQVVVSGQAPTVRRRYSSLPRDNQGRKRCVACVEWLPEASFHKATNTKDGLASRCASCYRDSHGPLRRHGITDAVYEGLLAKQGGRCPCGFAGPLSIDHDHACCPGKNGCAKCVRGLLCLQCNAALGNCRDDPKVLRALADYLEDK